MWCKGDGNKTISPSYALSAGMHSPLILPNISVYTNSKYPDLFVVDLNPGLIEFSKSKKYGIHFNFYCNNFNN